MWSVNAKGESNQNSELNVPKFRWGNLFRNSYCGRIDIDLYIETPDFYTHLRRRIIWLAHLLADVELYEQCDP